MSKDNKIKKYSKGITKILKAFGWNRNDCLITDESLICDLTDIFDNQKALKELAIGERKLKIIIKKDEYLWKVAKQVEKS